MPPDPSDKLALHRARFVDWTPAAITAVAPTPDGLAVAVGREDGEVELYNVAEDWQCVLRIPGTEGFVLTSLVWCSAATGLEAEEDAPQDVRLVAAGLGGNLMEYDLLNLRPKSSASSLGGPVWHMSAQPPLPGSQQVRSSHAPCYARRTAAAAAHFLTLRRSTFHRSSRSCLRSAATTDASGSSVSPRQPSPSLSRPSLIHLLLTPAHSPSSQLLVLYPTVAPVNVWRALFLNAERTRPRRSASYAQVSADGASPTCEASRRSTLESSPPRGTGTAGRW